MNNEFDGFTSHYKKSNFDDNHLVPMINVVFLMLIFFMVAGKVSQQDSIKVDPPEALSEAHIDAEAHTWIIAETGEMQLNGELIESTDQLNLHDHSIKANDKVVLKLDANLAASELDPILNALHNHGIRDIEIAVRRQL